jgi:AAA family ATPase
MVEQVQPSTQIEDPYSLIGGLETEIASIRELLEIPLVRPELYARYSMFLHIPHPHRSPTRIDLKPPKGILLHGPPGTGKTHLALTIASSLRSSPHIQPAVSVFHISGPELNSPYHGETEQRLRAVFQNAREKEPSVIILDEVDAICPRREGGEAGLGGGGGGEGGVAERVVATLLGEMDGLASKTDGEGGGREKRVVVVGTTNRPNAIDGALRRPGRFDREIEIGMS